MSKRETQSRSRKYFQVSGCTGLSWVIVLAARSTEPLYTLLGRGIYRLIMLNLLVKTIEQLTEERQAMSFARSLVSAGRLLQPALNTLAPRSHLERLAKQS